MLYTALENAGLKIEDINLVNINITNLAASLMKR